MDTNASSPKTSSSRLAAALSIGAVICAAAAGAATAQTTQQNVQAISIADLDLSSADGARAFLKRINIAAQTACGGQPVNSPLFPREPALFEKCVREAVTSAVRSTDEPMVASLHNETLTGSTTLASR